MEAVEFQLRPAAAIDLDFAWSVYELSMRPLTEALMPWRAERQRDIVAAALNSGEAKIIRCSGADCGWLQVHEGATHFELHQIYLARAQQRRGIGSRIVRDLQARAALAGRPVRLNVLVNNPARQLYERLGFRIERSDAIKHYMAWASRG